jgi:hypothetical protein
MLIEVLLQLFICQVDTKLLKAVCLEAFKPVDIQHSDQAFGVWILANRVVDLIHKPIKQP